MMLPMRKTRFEVGNSATKKKTRKNSSGFPVRRPRPASIRTSRAAPSKTASAMSALTSSRFASQPNSGTALYE
jgi:hypothetical protein